MLHDNNLSIIELVNVDPHFLFIDQWDSVFNAMSLINSSGSEQAEPGVREPGTLGYEDANTTPVSNSTNGNMMGTDAPARDSLDTDKQTKGPLKSTYIRTQGVDAGRVKLKYRCDDCSKDFKRKADLNRHLKTGLKHSPPRYKCDVCGKCYTRESVRKTHKCSEAGMWVET